MPRVKPSVGGCNWIAANDEAILLMKVTLAVRTGVVELT